MAGLVDDFTKLLERIAALEAKYAKVKEQLSKEFICYDELEEELTVERAAHKQQKLLRLAAYDRAESAEAERDRLLKVARVFLKNHHAHHPTLCIDGCDPLACGEVALIEVLSAAKGE